MHLIKKTLVTLFLSVVSMAALASLANPEAGKEYQILQQPQQTDSPGKVEITEFFYYSCPHCNALDPYITAWAKKQGNAISFKRVHVDFGQGQQPLQRMFYTLETMGKVDELHARIFQAIHKEHQFLRTDEDMVNFVVKNGIDKTKYVALCRSFGVEAKMRRAKSLQDAYKIEGVPTLFVDGKYMTSPSVVMNLNPGMTETDGAQAVLQVMDVLVLKSQKEHAAKK
jgi:protein dithiol oxidoreductase (disulfide-forming)